jgi:hypothetical protein
MSSISVVLSGTLKSGVPKVGGIDLANATLPRQNNRLLPGQICSHAERGRVSVRTNLPWTASGAVALQKVFTLCGDLTHLFSRIPPLYLSQTGDAGRHCLSYTV